MPPDDAGGWEPLDGADRSLYRPNGAPCGPGRRLPEGVCVTTVNEPAPRMTLIKDGIAAQLHDIDPEETSEWLASFDAMLEAGGSQRARYLMLRMLDRAKQQHIALPALTTTDYINTIPTESEPFFPGDEAIER